MAEPERPAYWPAVDLTPGEGLSRLAAYANTEQLAGSGLLPAGGVAATSRARRLKVSAAARELRLKKVRYAHGAVGYGGQQVVRHLQRLLREGGTCLDLAVLFSAQLVRLDLRPFLVVLYPDALAAGSDAHALVAVNLDRRRVDLGVVWPEGDRDDEGTATARQWAVPRVPGGWLACDPSVLTGDDLDLDVLVEASLIEGRERLEAATGPVWLVDVAAAHRTPQGSPLPAPMDDAPGLLTSRLPAAVPGWEPFDSHKMFRERLARGPAAVVLTGESGRGKSTIAREVAAAAAYGCGWFLNGSSAVALRSALAEQEGVERNLRPEQVAADVDTWAEAALSRLRGSPAPWAVVIDNADLDPSAAGQDDFRKLLPRPDLTRNQRLIITSTETSAWSAFSAGTDWLECKKVPALSPREVRRRLGIDTDPQGAATLPLMVSALQRLTETVPGVDLNGIATAPDPVTAYWRTVLDAAENQGPECLCRARRTGRVAALLPADQVPAIVFRRMLGATTDEDLRGMAGWGVLTGVDDSWTVHRLIAKAIRDTDDDPEAVGVAAHDALTDPVVLRHLVAAFDSGVFQRLREATGYLEGPDRAAAYEGLMVMLDERSTAKEAAAAAEEALNYVPGATHPRLRASCLLGSARYVNQHSKREAEELALALDRTREAQHWARSVDPMLAAKCDAMEGLLLKHVAMSEKDLDRRRVGLQDAYRRIILSRDERRRLCDDDPDNLELAKAVFNTGGVSLQLAKTNRLVEDVRHYLDDALHAYDAVEKTRRKAVGNIPHRHAAACTNGKGLIHYYRAVLLKDLTLPQRTKELRDATDFLQRALAERQQLEPDGDDEDVRKTLHVMSKIMLARRVVSDLGRGLDGRQVFTEPRPDQKNADATVPEALTELSWNLLASSNPVGPEKGATESPAFGAAVPPNPPSSQGP